jgi:DNA-binding SARP family transcriptional activator
MSDTAVVDLRLFLLRGFELRVNMRNIPIKLAAQRLVALLAVKEERLPRAYVSATLWPDTPPMRASANLRSALWRLQQSCPMLIESSLQHLRLAPEVEVDLHIAAGLAQRLLDKSVPPARPDAVEQLERLHASARRQLSGDLLPDWCDDWVLMERERFHQMRLHALEVLAERLIKHQQYGGAVDTGLAAVCGEPLRESARRVLIRAYLAEGNSAEAVRQYEQYEHLLYDELGIKPSAELRALLSDEAGWEAPSSAPASPGNRARPGGRRGGSGGTSSRDRRAGLIPPL